MAAGSYSLPKWKTGCAVFQLVSSSSSSLSCLMISSFFSFFLFFREEGVNEDSHLIFSVSLSAVHIPDIHWTAIVEIWLRSAQFYF